MPIEFLWMRIDDVSMPIEFLGMPVEERAVWREFLWMRVADLSMPIELLWMHREVSDTHREVSDAHPEFSDTRREFSDTRREFSDTRREFSDTHREVSDTHREVSDAHPEELSMGRDLLDLGPGNRRPRGGRPNRRPRRRCNDGGKGGSLGAGAPAWYYRRYVDWETRTRLYDLCNPEKALGPDDTRYVDVDAFGGPEPGPRGAPWAGGLVARIEPADRPVMERVTASPGAGLTMELRRIAARLTEKNGAHLLPVWIDAPDVLSPSAPIDVPDVLLAAAVESAVAQAAGAPVQDPLARLGRWIAPEGGDGRADVLGELRHGGVVRDAVRRRIDPELSVFVREVRGELTRHHAEARRLGYGGSW